MSRGLGTGGVWGGRTPPRIRDLCSKNFFENFFYLFGPPLDKNRSKAPVYVCRRFYVQFMSPPYICVRMVVNLVKKVRTREWNHLIMNEFLETATFTRIEPLYSSLASPRTPFISFYSFVRTKHHSYWTKISDKKVQFIETANVNFWWLIFSNNLNTYFETVCVFS